MIKIINKSILSIALLTSVSNLYADPIIENTKIALSKFSDSVVDDSSNGAMSNSKLFLNDNGDPAVTYKDASVGYAKVYNSGTDTWDNVADSSFTKPNGSTTLEYDSNGNAYLITYNSTDKIIVLKETAGSWVQYGSQLYASYTNYNDALGLAFDSSDTLYAIYSAGTNVYVKKHNGSDWVQVGSPISISGTYNKDAEIQIDSSNNIYVAMADQNKKAAVYKYNTGSSDWERLGDLIENLFAAYGSAVTNNLNKAYVASGVDGLKIFDISTPSSPNTLPSYDTPGDAKAVVLSTDETKAYVADGTSGLHIINIADPFNPVLLGTYNTSGTASDLKLSGNNIYIADKQYLTIVDVVTDPTNPTLVSRYSLTHSYAENIALAGNRVVLSQSHEGIEIIDISDPANPSTLATNDTGTAWAVELSSDGNTAYVVGQDSKLQILNITTPTSITSIGEYNVGSWTYDIKISADSSKAYLAAYSSGLKIIDITNPASPNLLGELDTAGAKHVALFKEGHAQSPTAFISDQTGGFKTIDISTPMTPVLIGTYATTGAKAETIDLILDNNGVPYIAYLVDDGDSSAADFNYLAVKQWISGPNQWIQVGSRGFGVKARNAAIAFDSNNVAYAYVGESGRTNSYIYKFYQASIPEGYKWHEVYDNNNDASIYGVFDNTNIINDSSEKTLYVASTYKEQSSGNYKLNVYSLFNKIEITIPENTTTVIDLNATDMGALTWSKTGDDSALFTLDSSTGELSFTSAPDYETPLDNGGDNVYDLNVTVSNGTGGTDTVVVVVTVDDLDPELAPELSTVVAPGSAVNTIKASTTIAMGNTLVYVPSPFDVSTPSVGDNPPAVTSPYVSGDDIPFDQDPTVWYLSFYELGSDGKIVSFYKHKIQAADIKTTTTPTPTPTPTPEPEPDDTGLGNQKVDSTADEEETGMELDGLEESEEKIVLTLNDTNGSKIEIEIPKIQGQTINTVYTNQAIEFELGEGVASYNNNGTTEHLMKVDDKSTVAISYEPGATVAFRDDEGVQTALSLKDEAGNIKSEILVVATKEGYSQNSVKTPEGLESKADTTILGTQTVIKKGGEVVVDTPEVLSNLGNRIETTTTIDADGNVQVNATKTLPSGEIVDLPLSTTLGYPAGSEVNIQEKDGAVVVEVITTLGTETFILRSRRK